MSYTIIPGARAGRVVCQVVSVRKLIGMKTVKTRPIVGAERMLRSFRPAERFGGNRVPSDVKEIGDHMVLCCKDYKIMAPPL